MNKRVPFESLTIGQECFYGYFLGLEIQNFCMPNQTVVAKFDYNNNEQKLIVKDYGLAESLAKKCSEMIFEPFNNPGCAPYTKIWIKRDEAGYVISES